MTTVQNRTKRKPKPRDYVWWDKERCCYVITSTLVRPNEDSIWLGRLDRGMFTAVWLALA